MNQHRHEQLLDHNYDGILEYDNPTPGWWHLLFIGSIVFSAFYAAFYHSSPLSTTIEENLNRAQQQYYARLFADLGELKPDEPTMLSLMQDVKWMSFGGSLFAANCAQCHGADGSGINGANLTDDQWINVKSLPDIYGVVTNGVTIKGMPAWNVRLGENERILVAAYVASLRANPRPGRAAEGEFIPPWPKSAPDSGAAK